MTTFGKAIALLLLVLGAGATGYFLRSDVTVAPESTDETSEAPLAESPQTTPDREDEDATETPSAPVGVTRDLSNQGLREVPRSEFDRRNTEILDLSGNDLVSLQAEVRLLANLRVLDLSDNRMTNIPAELGQLSKLEVLDLSNNELTGLPYELGNLTQLRTLDLRGNSYSATDLEVIRQGLETTVILTE